MQAWQAPLLLSALSPAWSAGCHGLLTGEACSLCGRRPLPDTGGASHSVTHTHTADTAAPLHTRHRRSAHVLLHACLCRIPRLWVLAHHQQRPEPGELLRVPVRRAGLCGRRQSDLHACMLGGDACMHACMGVQARRGACLALPLGDAGAGIPYGWRIGKRRMHGSRHRPKELTHGVRQPAGAWAWAWARARAAGR